MLTMRGTAVVLSEKAKTTLIEFDLPTAGSEEPELRIVESLTEGHIVPVDNLAIDSPSRGMLTFTTQDSAFTGEHEKLLSRGGPSWVYRNSDSTTGWIRGDIVEKQITIGSFLLEPGRWQQ